MGRLALGDGRRRLLEAHDLLVREDAAVVDELHRALGEAPGPRAFRRLVDGAAVDQGVDAAAADDAAVVGLLEVRDDGARPRDHARDGDELVDVLGVEIPQIVDLAQIVGPHLDARRRAVGVALVVDRVQRRLELEALELLGDDEVHDRHDLLRVAHELRVEVL